HRKLCEGDRFGVAQDRGRGCVDHTAPFRSSVWTISFKSELSLAGTVSPRINTIRISIAGGASIHHDNGRGAWLSADSVGGVSSRPWSIGKTSQVMPRKMIANRPRYAGAIHARWASSAVRRMENSLKKTPNGGDPAMARNPANQRTPDRGMRRNTPR